MLTKAIKGILIATGVYVWGGAIVNHRARKMNKTE